MGTIILGFEIQHRHERRTLSNRDAVGRVRIWAGDLLYSERKAA